MSRNNDDFHQFLGAMALGADGASRKTASPSLLSPLPQGPPPTGETLFKKKNRHVKTSSQPIKIDTNELRDEYERAAAQARLPSDEQILESEKSMKSQTTDDGDGKKKTGVGMSFTKRFPKMSLVRGLSTASSDKGSVNSSPRPRSPSKDSTVGGLMRMGNRSAIVSKLGFGKLAKRESDERGAATDGEDNHSVGSPFYTPSNDLSSSHQPPTIINTLNLPPTGPQLAYSASMPPGSVSHYRRSSAPLANGGPQDVAGGGQGEAETERRRDKRLSGTKATLDGVADFATNDMPPALLQEKNASTSLLQQNTNLDPLAAAARSEQEVQRWREDHAVLELNMARNVKGALILAKTAATGPRKRPSGGLDDSSSRDEAYRVAALTLQANNDARLRELSRKISAFEEKAAKISEHANRIRDDLLAECRSLVEQADKIDASLNADREAFKQKEISYRTANTKSENELASLNEKISLVLELKEKGFRDLMSDVELKLRKFATGAGGSSESGWLANLMDHTIHTMMDLILLGGGTIISLIYSLVVTVRSVIPGMGQTKNTTPKARKQSASAQGRSRRPDT